MNDRRKIIAGLTIFVALFTFPIWSKLGRTAPAPKPVLSAAAKAAGECILPKTAMKKDHMQLLDGWRNSVVRDGYRVYTNDKGKAFEMSLSNTCLECHDNKAEFCDSCHNYASVKPYCWDCHVDPKEKK